MWKGRLQRLSSILDKESEQTVTASTTTITKKEHLNKWLRKRTISYSQNVIGYVIWPICWWPWKFNYLPNNWMNYAVSDRCRTRFIGHIHCWHKQTELHWLPWSCHHLFQWWVWLAIPAAQIQRPLKSMERALDFKGLCITSAVPCVLPATELVILQITMYIRIRCRDTYWPESGTGNASLAANTLFLYPKPAFGSGLFTFRIFPFSAQALSLFVV